MLDPDPQRPAGRLHLRLAVALALIALVLPGAGLVWARVQVKEALTRRVEEGALATARSTAAEIRLGLRFALSYTQAAAHRPGLISIVQDGDARGVEAALENVDTTTPLFTRLAVFDRDGRPIAQRPAGPPLTDVASRRVFPAQPSGSDALLPVLEPITTPSGEPVGSLYAEISFNKAAPGTTSLRFGRTGRATVVDQEGRSLVTGEPMRAGRIVMAPELARLVREWRGGAASYHSPVVERDEVAAFVPVSGLPWGVLVTQAQSEAFSDERRLTRSLLVGFGVLVALGTAIAVLVGRTVRGYERRVTDELAEQRRLNAALQVFSSRIAHDLKDPLTTARMTAEVASSQSGDAAEAQRPLLEAVTRQLTRAVALVDDILNLARASGTPRRQVLDLPALVAEAADQVEGIELDVGPLPPRVVADRVVLRQALVNLLANAARYGRSDGVASVTVTCDESEEGWRLSVADRGPGLPEQEAERVFQPLEQGRRSPDERGTGLGLAIVVAAAAAHGGRAWYEPREGGGSVFSLFLARPSLSPELEPLPAPEVAPAPPRSAVKGEDRSVGAPLRREPSTPFRVVLADDVADTRSVVRLVLERSGRFEVVGEAADGEQAIELAGRHQPDLVLLDLSMPVLGGFEALPVIRERAPQAKVVVLSSLEAEDMSRAALAGGAIGYLEKGVAPQRLVDELTAIGGLLEIVQASLAEVRTSLASDARSPSSARRFVQETLERWDCGQLLDVVTLLVSELVTNAVVHAESSVEVAVQLRPDTVRIDVMDEDPTVPTARHARPEELSGRGLALVETLSSEWGVEARDNGKSIWFEVPRPDLVSG